MVEVQPLVLLSPLGQKSRSGWVEELRYVRLAVDLSHLLHGSVIQVAAFAAEELVELQHSRAKTMTTFSRSRNSRTSQRRPEKMMVIPGVKTVRIGNVPKIFPSHSIWYSSLLKKTE
jgi:hypothetical protein